MVVFTCQHCNEALKKPAVDKHYSFKCRKNPYLTCVDCLNDFHGDEYMSHTSCVSEDQRYGDKNFVPKAVAVKQNNWMAVVHDCITNNTNPKYIPIFKRLINQNNVPRKKTKFMNFLSNAMNMKNTDLAGEVFDLFQKEFEKVNSKKSGDEKEENSKTLNGSKEKLNGDENTNDKLEKKRNNVSESDVVVNGASELPNHKKDKKSKKQKTANIANDKEPLDEVDVTDLQGTVNEDTFSEGKIEKKKKKKSRNTTDNKENVNESQATEETEAAQAESVEVTSTTPGPGDLKKLSKKELKKLKKKQKYEAELKAIEEKKAIEEEEDTPEQIVEETKSKKNKRKARMSETEFDDTKKLKIEESNQEGTEEANEQTTEEPNRKAKFHWDEIIKELLRNNTDHEMSLKRLTKKVLAEYQAVKGDRESYEELMSKFNRKIHKIPGVKIIKDKARLIKD